MPGTEDGPRPVFQARPSAQRYGGYRRPAEAERLPVICWIRPTKVGERAWILCRAGICAEDFDAYKAEIAAACYAREARVTRDKKWS